MRLFLQDADFTLYQGDALKMLRQLPDESVHCVVTSPPYWGLRDYGTGTWEGGNQECDHKQLSYPAERETPGGRGGSMPMSETVFRDVCGKCGARRVDQQIGLEPTPDLFVANMVELFREVRRVLRRDGTCWLNLGDSYAASTNGGPAQSDSTTMTGGRKDFDLPARMRGGLKPKDLVGIPWRVAFALQTDGWYLRSDIIWAKPNPMPESVTDRPTKAHEYLFLLTRSARYFYDADAIREEHQYDGRKKLVHDHAVNGSHENYANMGTEQERWPNGGRNARSVWEIATQPYPEAHFATFPEELARRCIAAGCPEGGVVLDPFIGSGTVARVARRLGRRSIGIELNEDYCELAARRLGQQALV